MRPVLVFIGILLAVSSPWYCPIIGAACLIAAGDLPLLATRAYHKSRPSRYRV